METISKKNFQDLLDLVTNPSEEAETDMATRGPPDSSYDDDEADSPATPPQVREKVKKKEMQKVAESCRKLQNVQHTPSPSFC